MTVQEIAKQLVANGKGVFAADMSPKSIEKKWKEHGIEVTGEEARRQYREVLFTVKGLGEYVGGVIMHDESFRQKDSQGVAFTKRLLDEGVLPGIKVDKGAVDMPVLTGEKVTEGLDGLRERLKEYFELGARFTKWRAVIAIDDKLPTRANILANAHALARYAALSQEAGMVPIVEPEILMDGAHTIERCQEVTEIVAKTTFDVLLDQRVDPAGMLYKTNMVVMGKLCPVQVSDSEVAERTVKTLSKVVSVGVPGVVFLSGGQEALAATRRLQEINRVGVGSPWRWTFSFERAFEEPAMSIWMGKTENMAHAQEVLLERARLNSLASMGKYTGETA